MERTRKTNRKSPRGNGTPCPRCKSTDTKKNGYNVVAGKQIPRRKCNGCGQPFDKRTQRAKPACKCGEIGCTCNGNLGRIITWADGLDTADLVIRSPRYGKATLEHWSV